MIDPRMIPLCFGLLIIGGMIVAKAFVDWVFDWYWPEPKTNPCLHEWHADQDNQCNRCIKCDATQEIYTE